MSEKNVTEKAKKEPLFHILRRSDITLKKKAIFYASFIFGAMVLSGVICGIFSGHSPIEYFGSLFSGAFGTEDDFWCLLQDMALLLGASIALVPAFKMKFWNLGGNGQILIGALAATAGMFYFGGKVSDGVVILISLILSVACAVIWALIPAIFKAFFNTNETLFTLMMNYIASGLVAMFITIWVKSGSGVLKPISYGNVPAIGDNEYILSVIVFFAIAVAMYVYLRYSKHGYEISVVGESVNTAKYIGISVRTVIIRTLILSGAIAGLVGFFLVNGISHTVSGTTANNMGFTGIMTSWLAAFNPLIMFASCFFITFINRGMEQVNMDFGFTNTAISDLVIAIVYFCVIACSFFVTYRVVFSKERLQSIRSLFRKKKSEEEEQ